MLIGFALCAFSPFLSWVWLLAPTFFLSFFLAVGVDGVGFGLDSHHQRLLCFNDYVDSAKTYNRRFCMRAFLSVLLSVYEYSSWRVRLGEDLSSLGSGNQISSSPPGVFDLVVCFFVYLCKFVRLSL
jgi:hypothetical protein